MDQATRTRKINGMGGASELEASSGNVFADIGVAESEMTLAKAKLASQIGQIITARGLTQVQTAAILGVDQGRVSALVRGRLGGFSTERLFRFLNSLGRDIEITVKEKPRSRKRGRLTVTTSG